MRFLLRNKKYRKENRLMKIKNILKCGTALIAGGTLAYIHKDKIMQCCDKLKQVSKSMSCCEKAKLPTIVLLCDATNNTCQCTNNSQQNDENSNNCDCNANNCCCNIDEYTQLFNELSDKANILVINTSSLSPCCSDKFDSYTKRFEIKYLPTVLIMSNDENLIAKAEAPADINEVRIFIEDNLA